MRVQIARVIRRARQIEGVVSAGLFLEIVVRQQRRVGKITTIVPRGQGQPIAERRQPQRLVELPHQQGHLAAVPTDHRHLAGLVRRDRDRAAGLREPIRETRRRRTSDGNRIMH